MTHQNPGLASNPGPHRHWIYDRREEGLGKPPFCFASLPTLVGKISTQNSEPRLPFSSLFFDSQKRRSVARRRLSLSRYKHKAKPSLGLVDASTCSKKVQSKGNGRRLLGSEIVDSLARNVQSALNEMFFLPLFLVFLFFVFVARFLSGKTPVSCLAEATPVPHKERRASASLICLHCSKEGMYILVKQCVSSERCAMPKVCSVCHHGRATNPAIADEAFLARCWSGRLPQPGKCLRKTWQLHRQGYRPKRLYK